MLELQRQPILEGSQPQSDDDICKIVLGKRPSYSKDLDWGPRPKSRKSPASNSSTTCSYSTAVEHANTVLIEQQKLELQEARRIIEEQRRMFELQSKQMEEMMKKIEEMSRAQRGL